MNAPNDLPAPPPDYLNQIAPKATKTKMDLLTQKPLLTGGIILAVIVIVILFAVYGSSMSGGTKLIKTLSTRLDSTTSTAKSATHKIKKPRLLALNSNLNIYLTNTTRDLAPILALNNITKKEIDKSIIAAESNTDMLAILEDARLNAIYDRIYAKEMNNQLEKVLMLIRQIYKNTKSKATKSFLENANKNLIPIQKQFADYSDPNS